MTEYSYLTGYTCRMNGKPRLNNWPKIQVLKDKRLVPLDVQSNFWGHY